MRKLICAVCCAAILLSSLCINAFAETSEQFVANCYEAGDVNGDGSVNILDIIALRKRLVLFSDSIYYENTDINGDCNVNVLDLLLLRKKLAKYDVKTGKRFAKDNLDINGEIEDLGIPFASKYPSSGGKEKLVARNPFDMAAFDGKVYISSGNSYNNEGPVNILYVSRDDKRCYKSPNLYTEQANKFYIYDGAIFTLAVDPTTWLTGSYYTCEGGGKWTSHDLLANNIHCFDMIKHNGQYFFVGSNVEYIDGDEKSLGVAYVCNEEDVMTTNKLVGFEKFSLVPFINKYGDEINMVDHSYGVPRAYELMEFKGELYALYYDYVEEYYINSTYPNNRFDGLECNGVYKYSDENRRFEYCEELNILEQFKGVWYNRDRKTVMTDFEWNGQYIVVNDALYVTDDLKTWDTVSIPGFDNYYFRDCQVIGDKMYLLANTKNSDGGWTNAIFETSDLKSFRRILYFDTLSWARSFAYTNGAFFFCTGAYINEIANDDGTLTEYGKDCGRVYRYIYYK